METINEIAARIRELREVCDYTQEKLAEELGLSAEQYAGYEQNGDFPISVIYEIANKFGVDFNELVLQTNSESISMSSSQANPAVSTLIRSSAAVRAEASAAIRVTASRILLSVMLIR